MAGDELEVGFVWFAVVCGGGGDDEVNAGEGIFVHFDVHAVGDGRADQVGQCGARV